MITNDGKSVGEELIRKGYATPEIDGLFSDQLFDCYNALEVEEDTSKGFKSICGAVNVGDLQNPVKVSQLDSVSVSPLSTDFALVTILEGPEAGREIGIVFHGVSSSGISALTRQLSPSLS